MFDYLRDHAYKNIWCTPDQDNQIILEPAKLTPFAGAKGSTKVIWRNINLPDSTSRWHVYQIGQVHPLILGLFPKCSEWTSFAETCNRQKMICDIYNINGVQIPRFETYYIHNQDRNLIIAVKQNASIPFHFDNDKIFLRLYSNQFYSSLRATSLDDFVHVEGGKPTTTQQILDMQTLYDSYTAKSGQTYLFVNGLKVNTLNLTTVEIGNTVEFVYDGSIYKVVDFPFSTLREFNSLLDLKRKFLLHYGGPDNGTVDYQDDIDVFVIYDVNGTNHKGLYYQRNNEDSMRMVTHRDYSVCVSYFDQYIQQLNTILAPGSMIDPRKVFIRLHIRKSGWYRALIYEHNRIHELYKMQDADIQKAFLGIDSTLTNWRAEQLEMSNYTKIMRSDPKYVTNEMVQYAYGYNSVSKIVGDTPNEVYTFSSVKTVDVPYLQQQGCTVYEYDNQGKLLGWYVYRGGEKYHPTNAGCVRVEMIPGIGGNILDETYGYLGFNLNEDLSYRFYECPKVSGVPNNKFIDITNDRSKCSVINGHFTYNGNGISTYVMTRSDGRFLAYDTEVHMQDGQLKLTLNHLQRRGTTTSNWVMQVPMGEIDIFLNDRPVINNLDYFIDFPNIYVTNKEYLDDPINKAQRFHIRFTGFCQPDYSLTKENDVGFIEHGVLSNNNRFDLRDDKVLRIVVDGSLKTRADFTFSEMHSGVSIVNPINGRPYQIKDVVLPLRHLTQEDTYSLREKSLSVDKAVGDYLTLKIPQPPRPAVSAITARYQIFSPFVCKIIYDLAADRLVLEDRIYSVQEMYQLVKGYESILKVDPTQQKNKVNDGYVIIHPHSLTTVIQLSLNKYRFLQTVVNKYCNGLVNLSPFVQIAP